MEPAARRVRRSASSFVTALHRSRPADLAQIRAVRCRATDWVHRCGADEQIEIGAQRSKGIIARRPKLGARLPPTVLADDDARIEMLVEPRSGAHAALRRLDRYPVAAGDAACNGR